MERKKQVLKYIHIDRVGNCLEQEKFPPLPPHITQIYK